MKGGTYKMETYNEQEVKQTPKQEPTMWDQSAEGEELLTPTTDWGL